MEKRNQTKPSSGLTRSNVARFRCDGSVFRETEVRSWECRAPLTEYWVHLEGCEKRGNPHFPNGLKKCSVAWGPQVVQRSSSYSIGDATIAFVRQFPP